jgi:hypothetical protein
MTVSAMPEPAVARLTPLLELARPARGLGAPELLDGGAGQLRARAGRVVLEFCLTGGGTLVLLPLCWWCQRSLGLDRSELWVGLWAFHAASLLNDPHFAVTYLLFYRSVKQRALGNVLGAAQRLRYWVAGALVPVLLAAWAGWAVARDSAHAMGLLIQLMFFLVGWHYVKQGFGCLMVLSARRGVRFGPNERRLILLHCLAGWLYAWASPVDLGTKSVVQGVFYTSLAHPPGLEPVARIVFAVSAVSLALMLVAKRRREGRWPPLSGLLGLLVSIWLWTVFSRLDPLLAYLIPALHSLQYLYFVGLATRNAAREEQGPPSFKGSVGLRVSTLAGSAIGLGWLLLRGAPSWLDGALALHESSDPAEMAVIGPTPYLAAFVTFVNIHHYFMDYVIWRREQPETRHLLG